MCTNIRHNGEGHSQDQGQFQGQVQGQDQRHLTLKIYKLEYFQY